MAWTTEVVKECNDLGDVRWTVRDVDTEDRDLYFTFKKSYLSKRRAERVAAKRNRARAWDVATEFRECD